MQNDFMRIIGGIFRGRRIRQPGTRAVRPTKDRIREAVFNMIASVVPGSNVLDVFAGSGAYGLEAVSRGAENACFIDDDIRSVRTIKENAISLGLPAGKVHIIKEEAFRALKSLGEKREKFDIIFADPPFKRNLAKKTLHIINKYDILKPAGFLIVEHHAEEKLEATEHITILKQRTYGDIVISIFAR